MRDKKSEAPVEVVTKFEAAERQLKTSIRLFFEREDAVSIHTLACSAHNILHDIGKKRGIKSLRDDSWVRDDKKKEFHDIIKGAENFFKHGAKNKDKTFDFRPAITPFYILNALVLHSKLGGKLLDEHNLFICWFHLEYPETLDLSKIRRDSPRVDSVCQQMSGANKNNFELFSMTIAKLRKQN